MLINNATYQRETLSERPIRLPLTLFNCGCCGQLFDKEHAPLQHGLSCKHGMDSS